MVTVRNDELQAAFKGVQSLVAELLQQKVSPHLMMQLRRMTRAAAPVIEDVEQERKRLMQQYAKVDEKGEVITEDFEGGKKAAFETPEKYQEFAAAYQALMAVTSEQPETLTEKDLEGIVCKGEIILLLGPLLEE
jgi:hypothetical protein